MEWGSCASEWMGSRPRFCSRRGASASCSHRTPCRPGGVPVVPPCRATQVLPRCPRHFQGRGGRRPSARLHLSEHGSSWLARHASARLPEFSPPFSAVCRAVRPDGSRVDTEIIRKRRLRRQGGKDACPEAAMAPSVEAVVNCRRRTVVRRAILPAAPNPQNVNDPTDHTPVIYAPCPRLVLG